MSIPLVRVTPDVVVANVLFELEPLLRSGDPSLVLVYYNAAKRLRMLQR